MEKGSICWASDYKSVHDKTESPYRAFPLLQESSVLTPYPSRITVYVRFSSSICTMCQAWEISWHIEPGPRHHHVIHPYNSSLRCRVWTFAVSASWVQVSRMGSDDVPETKFGKITLP